MITSRQELHTNRSGHPNTVQFGTHEQPTFKVVHGKGNQQVLELDSSVPDLMAISGHNL
jgi:hypothetical protein